MDVNLLFCAMLLIMFYRFSFTNWRLFAFQLVIFLLSLVYTSPSEYRVQYDDIYIECSDKVRIHCWLLLQDNSRERPSIIYFHGNAGSEFSIQH